MGTYLGLTRATSRFFDSELMRRLHDGILSCLSIEENNSADCESAAVMVGAVDYLQMPIVLFVRLKEAIDFGELCEVSTLTLYC